MTAGNFLLSGVLDGSRRGGEQGDFYVKLLFHRLFNGDRKQES